MLNNGKKIDGFIKPWFLGNIKLTLQFSQSKQSAFDTTFNDLDKNIIV